MPRWIVLLLIAGLTACGDTRALVPAAPPTLPAAPQAAAQPTLPAPTRPVPTPRPTLLPTPPPRTEVQALEQLIQQADDLFYNTPTITVQETPHAFIATLTHPVMAGAHETLSITRYPTEQAAATAFGTATGRFQGFPSIRTTSGSRTTADPHSKHYGSSAELTWQDGRRIYALSLAYHSTMAGGVDTTRLGTLADLLYQHRSSD